MAVERRSRRRSYFEGTDYRPRERSKLPTIIFNIGGLAAITGTIFYLLGISYFTSLLFFGGIVLMVLGALNSLFEALQSGSLISSILAWFFGLLVFLMGMVSRGLGMFLVEMSEYCLRGTSVFIHGRDTAVKPVPRWNS